MSQVYIRKADTSDVSMISALAISVWIDTYAQGGVSASFGDYIARELSITALAEVCSRSDVDVWVALKDGNLVGFANVGYNRNFEGNCGGGAELMRLYIHHNFKGLGIGKTLLDQSFKCAVARGLNHIWLSVYHGNEEAIAFYRKLGLSHVADTYFDLNGEQHLNHVFVRSK